MAHGQAESLIPQVGALLAAQGVDWSALDRLAVTVGPGSFTGLRVGLAAAQGLALATGLPVVGITTLEVFATHAAQTLAPQGLPRLVVATVDARRDDVYGQAFLQKSDGLTPLRDPQSIPCDGFAAQVTDWLGLCPPQTGLLVCGDALDLLSEQIAAALSSAQTLPSPMADIATLAALAAQRDPTAAPPRPLYIRPPDAALPQHGGQLRPLAP
jgi:tRNA threonylcarbamoyladenosine biosynthesis protein TsaB